MGKTFLGKMQNRNWSWATAYIQPEGIVELINGQNIRVYQRDENGDIVNCSGTVTVTAGGVGFAKSCTYRKTDVVAGTPALYENIGTNTSCDFNLVSAISPGEIAVPEGQTLIGNSSGVAAATSAGAVTYKSLSAGATGVVLTGYHDSASPAANDVVLSVVGQGEDSAGNAQPYGKIDFVITDTTSTTEDGDVVLYAMTAGTMTEKMRLDSDLAGVMIGTGAANATLTSNGAFDLVLNTNSGTNSSSITIADAANGNVTVTPNGTGALAVAGLLKLTQAVTTRTGAGAIDVTATITNIDTTGGAAAMTLADGTQGQIKILYMTVDAGDATITPANFAGALTTITMNDVGDSITLCFNGTEWIVIGQQGCTLA